MVTAFHEIINGTGNLYQALSGESFLVINPAVVINNGIALSGGSYSQVVLTVRNESAIVRKQVKKLGNKQDIDVDLRLQYEAKWLSILPKPAAKLFPPIHHIFDTSDEFAYEMDFIPSPTVAELVFQGLLDSKQLFNVLYEVYSSLSANLYCHRPLTISDLPNEKGYLERIERRTKVILASSYPKMSAFQHFYNAPWIEV